MRPFFFDVADKRDILRDIESDVESYGMDGGWVTHRDASRQRDPLVRMKSRRASSPSTPRKLDDSAGY